jgi:threonine-phosphate decarboxylase
MSITYDHGGNIFSIARAQGLAPDRLIDFSASINPLGMSPMVRTALASSVDNLIHYPDASHRELKQALAKYHSLSPDFITIANGSTELIYNLATLLRGKKAVIISPSFSEYVRALDQHNWEIQHVILSPENGFSIDIGLLEQVLSGGADLLFLCNPGNPSGVLYSQVVIEQICTLCRSTGTFMILDEAFMDFSEETSSKNMIAHADNAVVLRSMTKFFGFPGLRLGYAVSNAEFAERLDLMGGPWNVNSLALAAGAAALQDNRHNRESLSFVAQERRLMSGYLAQFPQLRVYPSSANYLLVEILNGMSARDLSERLLTHGILIRDCSGFMGLTDAFFRIAIRTGNENKRLLECLEIILSSA